MSREKVLEQFMYPERIARLDRVLEARTASLTVVLDGVHNHHNISAVIRSADAFGLRAVHLVGDGFTYSRGVTLGTERWVDIKKHTNAQAALAELQQDGFSIVVTAPQEDPRRPSGSTVPSLPVFELPFEKKLAVVFGNERAGVSAELLAAADIHAFIPMVGFVESLNISVACAITLFCSMIGKADGVRHVPTLSQSERETLRNAWLVTGMKHADTILKEISRCEEAEGEMDEDEHEQCA